MVILYNGEVGRAIFSPLLLEVKPSHKAPHFFPRNCQVTGEWYSITAWIGLKLLWLIKLN